MLSWPSQADQVPPLRAARVPRLLVVDAGAEPPLSDDELQDWLRAPFDEADLHARAATLAQRAERLRRPVVDDRGLFVVGAFRTTLPPIEATIMQLLIANFGELVERTEIERSVWPGGAPTRNRLDLRIRALRQRIASTDIKIVSVRGQGFALRWTT
jgi:DNA-binding response OmpR family regulator